MYCEIFGVNVSFFSEETRGRMEEEMKKTATEKVMAVHKSKLPDKNDYVTRGRCKTYVPDPSLKGGRRQVYAHSEEEMILKLYDHYFGQKMRLDFQTAFRKMLNHERECCSSDERTIRGHEKEYQRFFKGDPFEKKELRDISVSDLARFLDRAHLKVSAKDVARGQKVIEKHRHNSIRTIINKVYGYANAYLCANATNPLASLDYASFPHYDADRVEEKRFYTLEDRLALLDAFDSIEEPSLSDLAAGFLLETAGRNSEVRGIRFSDWHFDEGFVRVCGQARDGRRIDRVKRDSWAGKRNVPLTPRLERIYHEARHLSWSDEFPFVMDREYVKEDEAILMPLCSLGRALRRLCKRAGVAYLPPHQIRFSDATLMAMEGRSVEEIQHRLGHTGPTMAQHYVRQFERRMVAAGPFLNSVELK